METTTENKSTRTDWMLFGVSTVACIALLMFADEWFWVALPFVLTYLVRALRVI
ncbi:MAG: hypothetical protein ACK4TA_21515 [Saprospiraceae bacterium]